MNSLRYLLAAIAALTLIMSVVSPINPGYFAGLNAFADHDEEDEEHDEEHDDESEEEDDSKGKEKDDEDKLVESLGENSEAELEVDDDEAELKVEIEDGDLDDGTYDVAFVCESPDLDEEFEDALEVDDGEGEFEQDLTLPSGTYSDCEIEVGELSATFQSFEIMANDDEDEDEEDDDKNDEDKITRTLGDSSKAVLEIDDDVELQIEIENDDLDSGTYDVEFTCDSPDVDEEFADALEVEDGEGEFEEDLPLTNGTYSGCEVTVGDLSAAFESFTVKANDDDDDENGKDDDKENDHKHEGELKKESELKADEDGAEIKVKVKSVNMTNGSYDAVFACDTPDLDVTLDDAFEVDDGDGELEETIGLADGTYSGCDITVQGTVLASFNAFTISEESEEEQKQKIEEKRKEKNEKIVTIINGTAIHEKHIRQNAASPGEYDPGWNYTLEADGTAAHNVHNGTADHDAKVEVDIDMAVWKSNNAIILLDVIDGTVEVENQTYTVVLGYALYTIQHDTFRLGALAVDDDGNVFKLKLRGVADGEFPAESGSIDLEFEGSSGPADQFGDWELTMDGKITAS